MTSGDPPDPSTIPLEVVGIGTGPSRIVTGVLPAGTYLLFVDGFSYKKGIADISARAV